MVRRSNPVFAGSGAYKETVAETGETVTLTASEPAEGKEFDKWVVVSGGITIDDETAPQTGFTMGTEDVVVQAVLNRRHD